MSYDLLIKNGTVVDGTGAPRRMADVAVKDGMIAEIGKIKDGAKKTIDADGLIVAPGFVDPHTHYDAQICWDPQITSSSWHGVTSVVMGNCGLGWRRAGPKPTTSRRWTSSTWKRFRTRCSNAASPGIGKASPAICRRPVSAERN